MSYKLKVSGALSTDTYIMEALESAVRALNNGTSSGLLLPVGEHFHIEIVWEKE